MKKRILIFCTVLTALGLMAFGVANWEGSVTNELEKTVLSDAALYSQNVEKIDLRLFPDVVSDVGPRFAPIKKGALEKARSINDFFSTNEIQEMVRLKSVDIVLIKNERPSDIRVMGFSDALTESQLELLQSFDYSSNFSIRADYQKVNKETGALEDEYANPHLTIVPERQAHYVDGKNALIAYLKENSTEALINVQEDKLRPAKLFFTVTKNGDIESIRLDNHSGYPELDQRMIELISEVPGKWAPAKNAKGIKVDQELVISFGAMGC